LQHLTQDHLVDVRGGDSCALDGGAYGDAPQFVGREGRQSAVEGADRSSFSVQAYITRLADVPSRKAGGAGVVFCDEQ
jgi:hypothetical protein